MCGMRWRSREVEPPTKARIAPGDFIMKLGDHAIENPGDLGSAILELESPHSSANRGDARRQTPNAGRPVGTPSALAPPGLIGWMKRHDGELERSDDQALCIGSL